jgi:hypothetical protein
LCGGLKNLKKKNILLGWQEFALTEKGKKIAATLALEVPPEEVGLVREEWILNFKKHEEKYSTWYKNLGYASVFYSNEELNDLITKYGLRLKLNNWPILSLRNDHD